MAETKYVDIGYRPHLFQEQVHFALKRFSVLVCHRRWGKTVFSIATLINSALTAATYNPRFAYVAPYRNQAKSIAWDYLKDYCSKIPGVRLNETELTVEFTHNGAKIRLFGADNAEAMRGLYFDGCVMDEVADMKVEVWGEIVRPALSDHKGWCLFIGTPKGMNLFFDLYNQALSNPNWYAGIFPVSKTVQDLPWLDDEELALARETMTDTQYRQEMECDFAASCENTLITIDLTGKACGKHLRTDQYCRQSKILGVDVARMGGDCSIICRRQGLAVHPLIEHKGLDNMTFAGIVAREIDSYRPDAVFIDGGRGEGVIDRLRQLKYSVMEVNFGSKARDSEHYSNRRAEMWDKTRLWLESGGALPDDYALRYQLVAPTYSFNAHNQMVLEAKDKIKARLGFSPDRADALALTFSDPVSSRHDSFRSGMSACYAGGAVRQTVDDFQL